MKCIYEIADQPSVNRHLLRSILLWAYRWSIQIKREQKGGYARIKSDGWYTVRVSDVRDGNKVFKTMARYGLVSSGVVNRKMKFTMIAPL